MTRVVARDFFNPHTMLGWRQQTGAAAVAYFRAPIGPSIFKAPLYSMSPRLVDFSFSKRGVDARWIAQLTVGSRVAWTNAPKQIIQQQGKVNLMEASQLDAGNIAVGLAAGAVTFNDAAPQTSSAP